MKWYRPDSLDNLLSLKHRYPESKIVGGNTEIGVEIKLKNQFYPIFIYPNQIKELHICEILDNGIKIGGSVNLSEFEQFLEQIINQMEEYRTKIYSEIVKMLHKFAGKQIRNVASLAGNIITASPISDLNPILMAVGATLEFGSKERGIIQRQLDEHFFVSYRKTSIDFDEVLISIFIPFSTHHQYVYTYKQSRRRDDDISIVTGAFNIVLEPETHIISDIHLVYGGMGPIIRNASKTCQILLGRIWDDKIFDECCQTLLEDLYLENSAPGGMLPISLTLNFKLN